ncbi:MAG: VWA domain-containing protein [Candidatus Omnitrophica bacterium]|nr:VWA domain-containing protein [Candidatus Omnitrophota bacterium]
MRPLLVMRGVEMALRMSWVLFVFASRKEGTGSFWIKRLVMIGLAVLAPAASQQAFAKAVQETEILFDASSSMNERSGEAFKLDVAKQALTTIAGQIPADANVGFRVFGQHPIRERGGTKEESCRDSELAFPIQPFEKERLLAALSSLQAYGQTAIGYSLQLAAKDFTPSPEAEKTIILISDGQETCGVDPVGVVQALKAQGIHLVIHAVGFAVDPDARAKLQALAEATGGTYADAQRADELEVNLNTAAARAGLLLAPARPAAENLLAASAGARIVSASTQEFSKLIDGKEETTFAFHGGETGVFSFKENRVVLLEGFAVPIFKASRVNPGSIELFGSLDSPTTGFFHLQSIRVKNEVSYDNVYQAVPIDSPVAIRYLKAVVGRGADDSMSYHTEWHAYGRYLEGRELEEHLQAARRRSRNVLAAENGGTLIASSNSNFQYLIDETSASVGYVAEVEVNSEGIFGFQNGQTALLQHVAVPILHSDASNVKTLEFWVSEATPTSGFHKVGTMETTNLVFAGNPYQEYVLDPAVKAKYLKVKVLSSHGGIARVKIPELRAVGFLED